MTETVTDADADAVRQPVVRRAHECGITTLTLDSPRNRNALSARLVAELYEGLEAAAQDPETRAVVLTHTGNTFCAGADLKEARGPGAQGASGAPGSGSSGSVVAGSGSLASGSSDSGALASVVPASVAPSCGSTSSVPPSSVPPSSGPPPSGLPASGPLGLVHLLRTIVELPKPVVARVTGFALAGGIGLLGACDISIAGRGARFAFTEARLGLAPAVISLPLLPRLDARAAARYYLTGEEFGAPEAARIGLVTMEGGLDVDQDLAPVLDGLRRASPQGLAESKRLVTAHVLRAFDRDTDALAELSARLFASEEAREGMTAFAERRNPAWAR